MVRSDVDFVRPCEGAAVCPVLSLTGCVQLCLSGSSVFKVEVSLKAVVDLSLPGSFKPGQTSPLVMVLASSVGRSVNCPRCLSSPLSSWWGRSRAWSCPATGRRRLQQRKSFVHTTVTTDPSTPCRGTPSSPKTSSPWGTGRLASGLRTSRSRPSCGPSRSPTL